MGAIALDVALVVVVGQVLVVAAVAEQLVQVGNA
jgi:hypothetical protein